MRTSEPGAGEQIKAVWIDEDTLTVDLADGRTVSTRPVNAEACTGDDKSRCLWCGTRACCTPHPSSAEVDEDLSVHGMLAGAAAPGVRIAVWIGDSRPTVFAGYPILLINPAAQALADTIMRRAVLPSKAAADALHIALAAVSGMNFLVTWNCTHIANGFVLQSVNRLCRAADVEPPIVCTPEELMEG